MNRTVTLVPSLNQAGSTTITIFVNDGMDTRSNSFVLIVTPVNDPPSFTKGANPTVLEDIGPQTVPGWAAAITPGPSNETGQMLTFTVTNNNSSLFSDPPAITANGTLTFAPAPNVNGAATVTIQLRDDGGTANGGSDISPPQSFTITIVPVNDAPSFTKGPNQTVAEDAGSITANGWVTAISAGPPDEVSQTLTFLVTNNNNALFLNQPAISPVGSLMFTPATNANGTATVTVRLQDSGGTANGGADTSLPQTFTITVTPVNDPPVLAVISDQVIAEGSTLRLTNTVTDVDVPVQMFTFSLEPGSPAGVTLNATNGVLIWTPTEAQGPSTNVIVVQVRDDGSPSLTDTKSFTVIVNEASHPRILELHRMANSARLVFTTTGGQRYAIEYRDTLGSGAWNVLTTVTGTGGELSVIDPGPLAQSRFYRVRVD
jgi:hypothetical protein